MATGKSPNLEVISNAQTGSEAAGSGAERRRRPRLNLTSEQFRLGSNGKIFSVADLSAEGMAIRILDPEDLRVFPVAAEIEGLLNLRGQKQSVRARVKRITPELVGCEFENLGAEARAALERFLDPKVLGQEIRPIPASDTSTLWYHGPSGTDLLLWRGVDGQYRRLTLYVLGSYVQWEIERGLSTGQAQAAAQPEHAEMWGVVRFDTMLMQDDAKPDPQKLKIAKELVLSSNLPQDLKKWCVRHFE